MEEQDQVVTAFSEGGHEGIEARPGRLDQTIGPGGDYARMLQLLGG